MSRSNGSRAGWLAAARAGDERAIAEVVRAVWPSLWRAAVAVTGSRETAEDAVQEALDRGFRDLDRFDDVGQLSAWLRRVTVNRAVDLYRSDRARADREHIVAAGSGARGGTDDQFAWASQDPELLEACRGLTPGARHVLLLHFWADMELDDIADALGVPVGTVKSRLARALSRLREDLQESPDDDA